MELSNSTGIVGTTDTLVFTCGKQSTIFNIILANITGTDSTANIKIFNKKWNKTFENNSLPDGNDLTIYLGKGLKVLANNTLEIGTSGDGYYLTQGDEIYVSCPSTDTLHYHVNVKTNM